MLSLHAEPEEDLLYGSYGLDQCVEAGPGRPGPGRRTLPRGRPGRTRPALAHRRGHRAVHDRHGSPARPLLAFQARALGDGSFPAEVGTAEFGNGTSTVHTQLAADALGTTRSMVLRQSDTGLTEHDTGAFGSAGTVVAGKATFAAAQALAVRSGRSPRDPAACQPRLRAGRRRVLCEGTRVPQGNLRMPPRQPASSAPRGAGAARPGRWHSTSTVSGWP